MTEYDIIDLQEQVDRLKEQVRLLAQFIGFEVCDKCEGDGDYWDAVYNRLLYCPDCRATGFTSTQKVQHATKRMAETET